jgi:hypothetical protein
MVFFYEKMKLMKVNDLLLSLSQEISSFIVVSMVDNHLMLKEFILSYFSLSYPLFNVLMFKVSSNLESVVTFVATIKVEATFIVLIAL